MRAANTIVRKQGNFPTALLAVVLLTVVTRLPALVHTQPIDDEAAYSVVANEVIDGRQPYVDAVERKPPFSVWTYVTIFKVAGKYNWKALHSVALLWTLATMAGLYVIGRRLFDRETGLIAALLYSIFQPWVTWHNLALNGELMMNLPIVWAWAIAFRKTSSRVRPELFIAGALLCAGFLLKQPAVLAAVPLGIYLLLPSYRSSRGLTWLASIVHAAMLTAGFFVTLGLITVVLWKQGVLHEALFWIVTSHTDLHVYWQRGILFSLAFAAACLPLLIGAVMALWNFGSLWAGRRAERTALFGLTVASALGTAVGGRFYLHYYIQLILPLALLGAPHFAALWSGKISPPHWILRPAVIGTWLAVIVLGFSIVHWNGLIPAREATEAGKYLREHSAPEDKIFVWGQHPKIYLEARRRPASRYILIFPLTGFDGPRNIDTRQRIMPRAWPELEEDLSRNPPTYILDYFSRPGARYPVRDFPILAKLLADRYHVVATTAEGDIYRMRAASGVSEKRP
jgi:4-amino-4-deoxy-L-arabinose transferase-like glycosyltransferase